MFDKLLRIGTAFDWISPLLAYIGDLLHGPNVTFGIVEGAGWSGFEVQHLLRSHGVKTWGLMAVNDGRSPTGGTVLITVPERQALRARYVLERAGVPLLYVPPVGGHGVSRGLLEAAERELEGMERWLESLEV